MRQTQALRVSLPFGGSAVPADAALGGGEGCSHRPTPRGHTGDSRTDGGRDRKGRGGEPGSLSAGQTEPLEAAADGSASRTARGARLQNPDGTRGRAGGPGEAVATASAGRTAPGRRPGSSAPFCTSPCVGPAWGTVPGDVNLTCSMHVPGHDPKPTQAVAVRNVKKKTTQRWASTRGRSDSHFCKKKKKSPRK